MNRKIDWIEYQISESFLPALINGDYSGLDDSEEKALNNWIDSLNHTKGHWDYEPSSDDWKICKVTKKFSLVCTVRWVIME
ncbi:MAG: hypothetical protein ACRCU2_13090 [Planktothrix sp.]